MPKILAVVILCLGSIACQREATVTGEIYVVTAGRETIKLSGTRIYFVPLYDVEQHFYQKRIVDDVLYPKDARFYLNDMPLGNIFVSSDSDGKFLVKLPKGQYVAVAETSRELFQSAESYYWLVKIDTNIETPVTLNNANLLDRKMRGKELTFR